MRIKISVELGAKKETKLGTTGTGDRTEISDPGWKQRKLRVNPDVEP